ncbi:MAG: 4-diphosphocytidyl-2C-methyl-D-erythritol synthase [Marmoricola sp.]|nr:4-diphosphocytidyl-2C-methyl-D-erythritol synthase [Marmoricola sp.]
MSAPGGTGVRAAIVLLAAGSGSRVGAGTNKVLLPLDGIPVLAHSVRTALSVDGVHRIVVVTRPEDHAEVSAALEPHLGTHDLWLVDGGAERHDSEGRALAALRPEIDTGEITVVALHDAARPLASGTLFRTVIDTAAAYGSAVPAVAVGPLTRLDGSLAEPDLVAVQTPQAFRAAELVAAYDAAAADGFAGTDTAAFLERYSDLRVRAVEGEATNLKVTFPEDLGLAAELLTRTSG